MHRQKQDFARRVRALLHPEDVMTTTTPITPMTKWQQRVADDQRARSIYARRRDIDRRHDEMRLERELGRAVG